MESSEIKSCFVAGYILFNHQGGTDTIQEVNIESEIQVRDIDEIGKTMYKL